MVIFIKLVMSILLITSMIILNFTIFRVSIKQNHRQITLISLIVGATLFYFKFVAQSPAMVVIQTFVYIILLMIMRRYPFRYALIVGVSAMLCLAISDTLITAPAIETGLSSLDEMQNNIRHYILAHAATSLLMVLSAYILHKFRIGFSFVKSRFGGFLTIVDLVWALILIAIIIVMQFTFENIGTVSQHVIILTLLSLSLIIFLFHAYSQNEKVKKDRFRGGK